MRVLPCGRSVNCQRGLAPRRTWQRLPSRTGPRLARARRASSRLLDAGVVFMESNNTYLLEPRQPPKRGLRRKISARGGRRPGQRPARQAPTRQNQCEELIMWNCWPKTSDRQKGGCDFRRWRARGGVSTTKARSSRRKWVHCPAFHGKAVARAPHGRGSQACLRAADTALGGCKGCRSPMVSATNSDVCAIFVTFVPSW